jgi:SAM-dependent methyltransferase
MTDAEIREQLARYEFYHVIPLTPTISTPGDPRHLRSQEPVLAAIDALDLRGKRVLDVGCRDGLYSFRAESNGAAEVIGIDNDLARGAVEFLIPFFRSSVRMHEMNVLTLTPNHFGQFDVVLFAGVLYHLRYPFEALRVLRDVLKPGGTLLIETAMFHGLNNYAMLYCPAGGDGPYGLTSCTFFNKKGLTDTLKSLGLKTLSVSCLHPFEESQHELSTTPVIDRAVFVCERTDECQSQSVDRYWHGTHAIHSQFGGSIRASDAA